MSNVSERQTTGQAMPGDARFAATHAANAMMRDGTDGMLLVEGEAFGRTYGEGATRVVALASASCRIAPGDRIAVAGPSGSGKSTLLQLMAGLDTPTSGVLRWPALGPRAGLRPAQIAVIFQQHSLLEPLSVVENVALPLLLDGIAPPLARAGALTALERLDLTTLRDRLPEELSGGQAQRVTVARALAGNPRLILADEPTGQLDRGTAAHVVTILLEALGASATALVVATHDAGLAGRMDHIWQIRHGLLEVDL